nr:phosphosulfolactate synthase [Desulfotomaculum copahuensis]
MNEQGTVNGSWRELLHFPLGKRMSKPREQGLTMIIDKGLGPAETRDILHVGGQYIDFWKLGFGTSALYPPEMLAEKVQLIRSSGIEVYPGGTFMEVAILQEKLDEYLYLAQNTGFTAVEVSDGTIDLPGEIRERAITRAAEIGLRVLTEVGKKEQGMPAPVADLAALVRKDLQYGAYRVILEGRESGVNVGLYDENGRLIRDEFEELLSLIDDPRALIWEAPLKDQQRDLIIRFGPDVNLGNIPPREVLALEALRVGLRADTLQTTLNRRAAG